MAWEARVRDEYKVGAVTAFGGREFVKGVWRPVPAEQVGSAGAHTFLEVREVGGGEVVVVDASPASAKGAAPAPPAVDEVDKARPQALDEAQRTPPEATTARPAAAERGGARRGKP